jgi:tetratricopeptide (TPR) repeat protein
VPTKAGVTALEHDVVTYLADAAAYAGDAQAARGYAARAEALATSYGHPLYLGIARRAMGIAEHLEGHPDLAESRLRQALEGFEQLGTRWQAGRTRVELGRLEISRRSPQAAREWFQAALEEFDDLGAMPDAERTRKALASLS